MPRPELVCRPPYAHSVADVLDRVALREVYDAQLRAWLPEKLPAEARIERDGPVLRAVGLFGGGFVTYRSLDGLSGAELDELIARQRDVFVARGESVEWKLHGHDEPADLPSRLIAAGFVPEEQETVVIGAAAPLAAASVDVEGVRLREVTARADLDRIAAMEQAVWSEDKSHLANALEAELAADPTGTTVVVAESADDSVGAGPVLSAGWVRYVGGTRFATLWGGSTLVEWRGRGIYKALVRYRARLAVERGFSYLQVDASDESRPILERNGFIPVTTTTPYVHPAP
jgi:GNAT superfamily N-acetyltransferase